MIEIDWERAAQDAEYREPLRWRAQTDLLWLTIHILDYSLVNEHDHSELAGMFIHKNPNLPIELQDDEFKTRLIIIPRRTYKTTLNIADTVQWVIGFPEVAVMAMTAANSEDSPLADAFVDEVASHLSHEDGAEPTKCEILFPECALGVRAKNGWKGKFTSPARKRYRRDPTVRGVSIEQSLSGWHPDIIKAEDVQDNRNSQTASSLKKVRKNFYINLKMLADWGFTDITGTRYGPADLYGPMLRSTSKKTKRLWRPAYVRKPHAMKMRESQLTRDDVILQFPRQLPWEFLQEKRIEDADSFYTQYMNIAEGNFKPTFPIEKLLASKVSENDLPLTGIVHTAWRFEHGSSKNCAAAVGIESHGRMFLVEIVCDQFSPTMLAHQVVQLARKWETHKVQIEETPGAHSMQPHILNESLEQEWRVTVTWTEHIQDDTARASMIKAAEPHLTNGRLLFSNGIEGLDARFQELYHYGMVEEIEVPDVVSRVAACLPASTAAEDFEATDDQAWEAVMKQDAYDRTFGVGKYQEVEPEVDETFYEQHDPEGHAELSEMMPGLSG